MSKTQKKTITIGKHMGLSKNRLAQDLMVNHHTYENGHVGAYSIFRQTHIRKHSYWLLSRIRNTPCHVGQKSNSCIFSNRDVSHRWASTSRAWNSAALRDLRSSKRNDAKFEHDMAVCQNLVPLVNPKIAGKWMFIPLKISKNCINRYWSIATSTSLVMKHYWC